MELKGKAALITGGARLGQAVAEALAGQGCHVALTYRRSKDKAEAAAARCRALGVKALVLPADARRNGDAEKALRTAGKAFGRLDVLVNMASFYEKTEDFGDDAAWLESMETDLGGTRRFSLKAAPLLKKNGGGRIINFTDWVAASGRPRYKGYLPYYAAKAGVKALTEALALELAPEILVNSVAPGPIEPPPGMSAWEKGEVVKQTPLGRWGGAAEIARAVLFLAETDFVTGECLRVDGGRHLY